MKIKDWFKPNEDQTTQVIERSIGSTFEKFKSNKPLSRTNIRKWRDNIYNSDTLPMSPINLTRDSAQTLCLPPLEWTNFKSAPYSSKIINSGHTTIVKGTWYQGKKRPYLSGGPLLEHKYVFYHSHFHWGGSEHALQGESFPMEVHNVFYNEKYKSHELALNEKDGIVIVVQFCRLSPHQNCTASQMTQSSSLKSEHTRSQFSSISEDRKTGSYLRSSYYTQMRNNQNNNMYYNGYKPIPLKDLKPVNISAISTKRINEGGDHFPTIKISVHNRNQTKSADLAGLQSTLEQNNVFVEEIAKNIRFVRTVNTSKLIHAYCLDRLVRKFIGNYYFYLSGIRRHQTVYRITWIVDDENFLFLSKSQLRSFHLLKTAQNTKIIHNTRRTQYERSLVGNLFYIINEGGYNKGVSLGSPQHSKIGDNRVSSNIISEDAAENEQVKQILEQTNQVVTSKTQVATNECSIVKTDLVNGSPMIEHEHELLPGASKFEIKRKLINTIPTSKEKKKTMPDVSTQIFKIEDTSLEVKSSKKSLNLEADLTNLHENGPIILYENKQLQMPTEQDTSSSMMNSDFKMKTSIFNLCTEDFYDYLQALFKKIIETIKFTIDVPYCSSLQSTDTSVEQCNIYYSDEDTISKNSFENSKLLLIPNSKVTLSSTCEKVLELFLPYNKRIENYKHSKRDPETKMITVTTKTKRVRMKTNKLVLKNRYRIRKVKPCNVLNVMRVLVSQSNVNIDNLFENIYHVQSPDGHVNEQHLYTRDEGCFLDSSLFQSISIPSFSTDFASSLSTVVNTVDNKMYEIPSFDSEDIFSNYHLSDQYYTKESWLNMKSNVLTVIHPKDGKNYEISSFNDENQSLIQQSVPCYEKEKSARVETNAPKVKPSIDTKIPRPKTIISERKKMNLNLSVQKPLRIKTTGRKFPASAPPDMNHGEVVTVQDNDNYNTYMTETKPTCQQEIQKQSEEKTATVINKPFLTSPENNIKETNPKEDAPKTNIEVIESKTSFSKILARARRAKIYAKKYKLRPKKRSDP